MVAQLEEFIKREGKTYCSYDSRPAGIDLLDEQRRPMRLRCDKLEDFKKKTFDMIITKREIS